MKKLISKSLFVQTWLCPKGAWLKRNKPDAAVVNENTIARMETGREVGEIARGLFGPYRDVTSLDADGKLDLERMAEITRAEMEKGTNVICEASFFYADCYCAVDKIVLSEISANCEFVLSGITANLKLDCAGHGDSVKLVFFRRKPISHLYYTCEHLFVQ